MSGQATGWVLRHGPRPTDLDVNGKAYGLAGARSRRLVLAIIADAADRNGQHAHPGGEAIEEGALYSRSQARAIVKTLEQEGWVLVVERGGGRGKATVYDLPGVADPTWAYRGRAETVRPPAVTGEGKGPIPGGETVRSGQVNRPESEVNRPAQADPQRCSNGTTNGRDSTSGAHAPGDAIAAAFADPDPKAVAKGVTDRAWERKNPRPTTPWIAVRRMVEAFLDAGWQPGEVEEALVAAPTLTKGAIEFALNRARDRRPGPRTPLRQDRGRAEGRLAL